MRTVFVRGLGLFGAMLLQTASVAAEPVTLKLATVVPEGTIWHTQLERYADRVNELSEGDVTIEIFGGAQLGGMGESLKNTLRGRNDIWSGAIPAIGTVTSEFSLLSLPYLFRSTSEAGCALPKLVADMQGMTEGKYHLLALTPVGTQSLGLKQEVRVPSDMAGIKFRVAPLKPTITFYSSLGANAVPLDPAESTTALSTGLVDGVDYAPTYYMATGANKLAPIFVDTQHNYNVFAIVLSNEAWGRLTDEQKAVMDKALDQMDFDTNRIEIDAAEQAALERHVSEGGTWIQFSDEERAAWAEAGRATWDDTKAELRGDIEGFMAKIDAVLASCR